MDVTEGYIANIIFPDINKVFTLYNYQNYQKFTNSTTFPYDNVA
jgi:hypothetical protein